MSCQDFQLQLLECPKGAQDGALREHLRHCPDCQELQLLLEGLGALPQPEPPAGMALRFHQRLAAELARGQKPHPFLGSWWLPLSAAALLLLGGGLSLGYLLRGTPPANPDLALLQRGSAADRMEAIALVHQRPTGQGDMVSALLDRVGRDASLEVRLSAVEALYLFGSAPDLSQRLEAALPSQDHPEVQLALIDLMAALRQRRAAEALRRLVREQRLPPAARQRAEQRLAQMQL